MLRRDEKPTQLHNNCSGKHTSMLGQALLGDSDLGGYLSLAHPVQQEILRIIELFTDIESGSMETAVDGCSAPNYVLSMRSMARSYARLVNPPSSFSDGLRTACGIVTTAMTGHPQLIAGTNRLDTLIMESAPKGTIVSKIGAEGVWLCGISPNERWSDGLGIALKIGDGDDRRARPVVAVELLKALGALESDFLHDLSPMPIKSRLGEKVGEIRCAVDFDF
jgi:L-asparaginase II